MSQLNSFSLTVRGISVARADRPVLVDIGLTLTERSRVAILGPNGVGKSTLLRVIAGSLKPDSGTITAAPPSATVGLLEQELQSGDTTTTRELIATRLGITHAEAELANASEALGDPADPDGAAERYDEALQRFLSLGASDFEARLEATADQLGLSDRALNADPAVLSGGEAERVGLAMVILSRFDLTLLDEPTNNLDLHGLEILEGWVANHRGGLVMVSHDRAFLEQTVSTVVEIDHHRHTAAVFNGGWQAFLDERERAAAHAKARYEEYAGERGRLAARAQTQQEWAAQGVSKAKKNPADGDKFRKNFQIAQTEHLASKAKATKRAIDRLEVVEKPWEPWQLQFTIANAPRSSDVVAALDKAVLRRGDFVLGPIDVEIRWADRLAIVGKNGSGKSTLIEALLGRLTPESGSAKLGSGVVIGELGQRRDGFSPGAGVRTLLRAFQDESALPVDQARSVLAKFGLDAEVVAREAQTLSPGERTRARLALFQATGVNLLVLDEPTNHLDLEAIEQLESAIASFSGTLILVSHDRQLLEQVTLNRTLEL